MRTPNLPFDPRAELLRWGPIPGCFLYCSAFAEVNYKHFAKKYSGENWPESLFLFQDGRMLWLNDYEELRRVGQSVFRKYMLPESTRQDTYEEWTKYVHNLLGVQGDIKLANLQQVSNVDLLSFWQKMHEEYLLFWLCGTVPELANYGADKLLENSLRQTTHDESTVLKIMEILTAPEKMSFYQEEEVDLAEEGDLVKHQENYFWLKNSYAGTKILEVSFFAERKKLLALGLRKQIIERLQKAKEEKIQAQKDYGLSVEIMNMSKAICDGIAWQDERKKYVFIALHYEDLILCEIARRFNYDFSDLHCAWYHEIDKIINGEDLHLELRKRRKGFGLRFFKDLEMLDTGSANFFWHTYTQTHADQNSQNVRGLVVCKGAGVVKGVVKILLDPAKVETFNEGDVLLAPMTSPEYIFAMKKAAAIVTDEGGLTSHAAIVSRELGIPCIVGTKIATKIFRDGDVVEIFPELGEVRLA